MNDLDAVLARLAESPVHPDLVSIDDMVLGALAARAGEPTLSRNAFSIAALAALFVGILGSALPGAPVRAAALSPLGAPGLAPSTLLEAEG